MTIPPRLERWLRRHPRLASVIFCVVVFTTVWEWFSNEPILLTFITSITSIRFERFSFDWVPFVVIPVCVTFLILIWINTLGEKEIQPQGNIQQLQEQFKEQAKMARAIHEGKPYTLPRPPQLLLGVSVSFLEESNGDLIISIENNLATPIKHVLVSLAKIEFWSEKTKRFITYSGLSGHCALTPRPITLDPETPISLALVPAQTVPADPTKRFGIWKFEVLVSSQGNGERKDEVCIEVREGQKPMIVDNPGVENAKRNSLL
jgi:hypothetical protein